MLRLFLALSAASLVIMILIDRAIGARAEFLNAWSVIERLLGKAPSAGESMVAARFGPLGEFAVVILANSAAGAILTFLVFIAARIWR